MKYRTIYLRVPEKEWKQIENAAAAERRSMTNYLLWMFQEYGKLKNKEK